MSSLVWIIDFGSQYTQLIVRRTRELGFSAELIKIDEALNVLKTSDTLRPACLVLSGGPGSVSEEDLVRYAPFFESDIPLLGICYGQQLMAEYYGGQVTKGVQGEYGATKVELTHQGIAHFPVRVNERFCVWMAHFDEVKKLPESLETIMMSEGSVIAGIRHRTKNQWGFQFHPEVEHSENGAELLKYFYSFVANLTKDWGSARLYEEAQHYVAKFDRAPVLCAFSGGVDSLVAASLMNELWPSDVYCFFVDNGLLRPQDYIHIQELKEKTALHIEVIQAQNIFLKALEGVSSPEEKRTIIGHTFISVFEQKAKEYEEKMDIHFKYLLQGTLYPDVIESLGGGKTAIKKHHNVGGLPEKMKLTLLEPLRFLFKDEVRDLGKKLELKQEWLLRHPCPGPGLSVRILGAVEEESLRMAQMSDQILFEELNSAGLYNHTWQAFTVVLPILSVGVKGDERAYERVVAVRCVNSRDAMTAVATEFPYSFLKRVSARIANEVPGVCRVVYDITSKPPATIEWE